MTDQVMAAHDASVDAALGYLERTATWSNKYLPTVSSQLRSGIAPAAGDPHLHTRVLVANIVRISDDGVDRSAARSVEMHVVAGQCQGGLSGAGRGQRQGAGDIQRSGGGVGAVDDHGAEACRNDVERSVGVDCCAMQPTARQGQ